MSIRLSGMVSGMDTDSMVQELVKASSAKKESLEKAQTKLGWTQTAWSDLNTKIYGFYNKFLDNMKYEGSYSKKKTTVADTSIATVTAGDSAVNGTQSLAVKQLASSGYLTGGKLGKDYTSKSTMADLGAVAEGENATIEVNGTKINLSSATTIDSFVKQLNDAGVTASYDTKNQRFFIAAKSSGSEADFTITANDDNGLKALQSMKLLSATDAANNEEYTKWANMTDEELAANAATEAEKRAASYYASVQALQKTNAELADSNTTLAKEQEEYAKTDAYKNAMAAVGTGTTAAEKVESLQEKIKAANADKTRYDELSAKKGTGEGLTAEEQTELNTLESSKSWESLDTDKATLSALQKYVAYDTDIAANDTTIATNETTIADYQSYYNTDTVDADGKPVATAENKLLTEVTTEFEKKRTTAIAALAAAGATGNGETDAVRVVGQDAKITLNGAEFTSDSNSFSVNGLTITANAVSEKNTDGTYKTTTVNTTNDVDGIYNMVKTFLTQYNTVINAMDAAYNADSSKGYEPLTDEEKESMTDSEIEKWEKKIKDALLRKDDTLNSDINLMKTAMSASFTVNGTSMSLSDFGINTLSYFVSADNEHGAYHIDGDADDSNTSSEPDKLKTMIATDPETVTAFFTKLTGNMYDKMKKAMSSSTQRSINKMYDDKKMQSDYDDYKTKITAQEKKLTALEDRYYKQFTAMEKAMSTLNSQQSSLSSLFGS
ncbi:MAG: flagellar filament capping protein FliD [Lachnospiraceae bacterium]|nr:flagellar filament capping protein FliD [Lachnospiraceae bacterium]